MKDVNRNLVKDVSQVRWVEYFESFSNVVDERDSRICAAGGVNVPVMLERMRGGSLLKNFCETLKGTKAGKAPGVNECRPEYLKKGGVSVVKYLLRLLNECLAPGRIPVE